VQPEHTSPILKTSVAFGQKPDFEKNPEPPSWVQQGFEESRRAHTKQ